MNTTGFIHIIIEDNKNSIASEESFFSFQHSYHSIIYSSRIVILQLINKTRYLL